MRTIKKGNARAHTYFIRRGSDGAVKIGRSVDPLKRLKQLQTANDETLQLIGVLTTDVESQLHSLFAHLSIGGEWFEANDLLLEFIAVNREDKDSSDEGLRRTVKAFLDVIDSDEYRRYELEFALWRNVQEKLIDYGSLFAGMDALIEALRRKVQPRTHPIQPKEPTEWDDDEEVI